MLQVDINSTMDDPAGSSMVAEGTEAVRVIQWQSPGADAIPAEIYKIGGPVFTWVIRHFGNKELKRCIHHTQPQEEEQSTRTQQPTKESRCSPLQEKALLRVLVTQLELRLLPESQCGFLRVCWTIDT